MRPSQITPADLPAGLETAGFAAECPQLHAEVAEHRVRRLGQQAQRGRVAFRAGIGGGPRRLQRRDAPLQSFDAPRQLLQPLPERNLLQELHYV